MVLRKTRFAYVLLAEVGLAKSAGQEAVEIVTDAAVTVSFTAEDLDAVVWETDFVPVCVGAEPVTEADRWETKRN